MAYVDIKYFRESVTNSNSFKGLARGAALQTFNSAMANLRKDFETHPVTTELDTKQGGGADSNNDSGTTSSYGNLFSFIGFYAGENPVQPLRNILYKIKLPKSSIITRDNIYTTYSFEINIPEDELYEAAPMPDWDGGRSWLTAVEEGIPGLKYYLYREGKILPGSHSGPAIQIKRQLRAAEYKKITYMSEILENFTQNLK